MLDAILKFWPVIICVMQLLMMWGGWSLKKEFVSKDDLAEAVESAMKSANLEADEIEKELRGLTQNHQSLQKQVSEDIDRRLVRIEESIKHMPTHGDLTRLHKRIDEINTQLQQIGGAVAASTHTLRLIEQHLLANAGGKPS